MEAQVAGKILRGVQSAGAAEQEILCCNCVAGDHQAVSNSQKGIEGSGCGERYILLSSNIPFHD